MPCLSSSEPWASPCTLQLIKASIPSKSCFPPLQCSFWLSARRIWYWKKKMAIFWLFLLPFTSFHGSYLLRCVSLSCTASFLEHSYDLCSLKIDSEGARQHAVSTHYDAKEMQNKYESPSLYFFNDLFSICHRNHQNNWDLVYECLVVLHEILI